MTNSSTLSHYPLFWTATVNRVGKKLLAMKKHKVLNMLHVHVPQAHNVRRCNMSTELATHQ